MRKAKSKYFCDKIQASSQMGDSKSGWAWIIDEWKLARVIPIYKSEDKRKCENYRPISILPIISKIYEGDVFTQIYSFLNKHALLSKFQSGFRPKHGTLGILYKCVINGYKTWMKAK